MLEERTIFSALTLTHTGVINLNGENLGAIVDLGIDIDEGRIAYGVLSFGGILGGVVGDKWFAVPWEALEYSRDEEKFILNLDQDFLKEASGFDKDHWPDAQDRQFALEVFKYYGRTAYWEKA